MAAERQRGKRSRPKVVTGPVKEQVDARLLIKHSPDQISKTLGMEGMGVSHEAIYRYIDVDKKEGGELWRELRINGKRRYRRRSKVGRGEKIPDRVDIDQRPPVVSERARYGDWEADLIQGAAGSGYLLSVYERKSRLGKLFKLTDKRSRETARGLVRQYFPKRSDFEGITQERLQEVEDELNDRPRNVLDYRRPNDHLEILVS